ncbi:DUF3108 domain-containing protein [Thiohalobacter sp.]|uniref:DUF3108 domain-containing protein n=1 Tax=Thiohalobacter sp. TaxID=2025948 RepID=UPI002638B693|nr:DUF3108 domain-containing protein [Thiohalobacter sp.]
MIGVSRRHVGRSRSLLAILLAATLSSPRAAGWDGAYERLLFDIRWLFVPAGVALVEARPRGEARVLLRVEACSNAALDLFYRVRDLAAVEVLREDGHLRPLQYRYSQTEGSHRSELVSDFSRAGEVVQHDRLKGRRRAFPVPEDVADMVTAFFRTRALDLAPDAGPWRIPVFDKGKSYLLEIEVLRRERIDTLLGKDTPTVVIRPRLQTEGIFKRTGDIFIWLTDDARHLPVRMESRVRIGSIVSSLIAIEREPVPLPAEGLACEALRETRAAQAPR